MPEQSCHPEGHDQPTAAATVPPDEMMPCPVCREPIRAGAKKCTHCDSDLGWRRYMGLSNTTLALLTALVSVLVTAAPAMKRFLEPDDSRIRGIPAASQESFGETIWMLVSNSGRRMGVVAGGFLNVSWRQDGIDEGFFIPLIIPSGPAFVPEEHTQPLALKATLQLLREGATKIDDVRAWFNANLGRNSPKYSDIECKIQLDLATASGYYDSSISQAFCQNYENAIGAAIANQK